MKKRKITFRMTAFSILVLILIAFLMIFKDGGRENPLFDKNNSITLYLETETGTVPQIDFSVYFPDSGYDFTKFTYDKSNVDFQIPGSYTLPVYYDGELTTCVLQLSIKKPQEYDSLEGFPETELKKPQK
ncbi:MAG: hypothetical protein KH366_18505 [Clostridiaceae bacterium]|nr:hypothetical protein [Clostridiaceae bacterium]